MLNLIYKLYQQNFLRSTDYYFAKMIDDIQRKHNYSQLEQDLAVLLATLCSYYQWSGHTCVKLDDTFNQRIFDTPKELEEINIAIVEKINGLAVEEWQKLLSQHVAFTAEPLLEIKPLVFCHQRLYFYRTWQSEYQIAQFFIQQLTASPPNSGKFFSNSEGLINEATIQQTLDKFFPPKFCHKLSNEEFHWQKIAVAVALNQPFTIITGGPGTGKTTTVSRLLLALQSLYNHELTIKLVAPTGKASSRLTESLWNAVERLESVEQVEISPALKASLPKQAETIHRLLGLGYLNSEAKFNQTNPLLVDVLVVDEASMIDLSLMAKLINALTPNTKLILLGDQDQLSSVEAGAVLAELTQFQTANYSQAQTSYLQAVTGEKLPVSANVPLMRDSLCQLVGSRRFGDYPQIGKLANLINQQQANKSWNLLTTTSFNKEVALWDYGESSIAEIAQQVIKQAVVEYQKYFAILKAMNEASQGELEQNISQIFKSFNQVRFLTAVRQGFLGSEWLNEQIFEHLKQAQILQFAEQNYAYYEANYLGKPILITRNNHNLKIYNGDIGIYIPNAGADKQGRYYFEDGRSILASRLTNYANAYVMTVHKSQGSEFEHCYLVLPNDFSPVLTKELVYTGITRAKAKISIFTNLNIWQKAVLRAVKRQSGLGEWFKNIN